MLQQKNRGIMGMPTKWLFFGIILLVIEFLRQNLTENRIERLLEKKRG